MGDNFEQPDFDALQVNAIPDQHEDNAFDSDSDDDRTVEIVIGMLQSLMTVRIITIAGQTTSFPGMTEAEFETYATNYPNLTQNQMRDIMYETIEPKFSFDSLRNAWYQLQWSDMEEHDFVQRGEHFRFRYIQTIENQQFGLLSPAQRLFAICFYKGSNFADNEEDEQQVWWMKYLYAGPDDVACILEIG